MKQESCHTATFGVELISIRIQLETQIRNGGKKNPYLLIGIFGSRQLGDRLARNHQEMGWCLRTNIVERNTLQKSAQLKTNAQVS
jgi:hypothetical protein